MSFNMKHLIIIILYFLMVGCTYYEIEEKKSPQPDVPNVTTTLEAVYVTAIPNKLTSNYWKTADFLKVTPQNQTTGQPQVSASFTTNVIRSIAITCLLACCCELTSASVRPSSS